jgi:two-component system, LuxR family, response regulator FixJ
MLGGDGMGHECVYIVDDDKDVRESLGFLLEVAGFRVRSFASAKEFLADSGSKHGCLITDVRMPDMTGPELQEQIIHRRIALPVIIMTGHADVPLAVQTMRAGAIDFLEKPLRGELIIASVQRALKVNSQAVNRAMERKAAREQLSFLTPREHAVLEKLVQGCSNKVAAHELGISTRTVEVHRAHITEKLHTSGLAELVRMALAAG